MKTNNLKTRRHGLWMLAVSLLTLLFATACSEEQMKSLEERMNNLEAANKIQEIEAQLASINSSIAGLEATDANLKGYIDALQAEEDNLKQQLEDHYAKLQSKVDSAATAGQARLDAAIAAGDARADSIKAANEAYHQQALAMMDSISASIGKQIANLEMQTLALSRQDTLLESRITDLHTYVDEQIAVQALVTQQGIKALTDSLAAAQAGLSQRIQEEVAALSNAISASQTEVILWTRQTFATLEQYDSTCVSIAGIQARVSMTEHGLDSLAQQLNATRETLTQEYSQALTQAIGNLETSLKTWVNERLTGYYTIAETDAHLSALTDTISANNQKLAQRIAQLQDSLDHAKVELTKEYQAAIQTAIAEEDGVITKKIADEVAAINSRIDTEVAAINASIQSLSDRVTALEQEVADLKKIPEITFSETNPSYIPGDVVTIGFTLTNADENTLVETIADAGWKAVVTMDNYTKGSIKVTTSNTGGQGKVLVFVNKGGYTIMRALLFDEGTVTIVDNAHTVLPQDTTLVVTLATNLPDYKVVIPEDAQAWIALLPSTKAAMREEVLMFDIAQNLTSKARSAVIKVVSTGNETLLASISIYQLADVMGLNEIWYTSTDGQIVTPTDPDAFHANIVSNTYANGKGVIRFDADVDRVAMRAFHQCRNLKSISLPEGVTSIGDQAFGGCTSLASIILPENLTSIGIYSFNSCSSLASISLPDGLTSIGRGVFRDCSSLTSITLPDGLTSIGEGSFLGCSSLASITLPDGLTSIGESSFLGCSSLASITLPDGLASIGANAFGSCSSLTSIELPDGLTSISKSTFYGCSSLTSITLPDGLTSIGQYAFQGCSSLTSIILPNGLTSIGGSSFYGCSSLASITLPDGVTSIESDAFRDCSSLTSITLPKYLQFIGNQSFYNCKKLKTVYADSCCYMFSLPTDAFAESYIEDKTLVVPHGRKSWYESADGWKDFGTITESESEILPVCEAVDLGLSVNWATCNVGAYQLVDIGDYYAWGETELKANYYTEAYYNWETYKWCSGMSDALTKYNTKSSYGPVDDKIALDMEDDIARVEWGGDWRMPTKEEYDELLNNCTWTWSTEHGVNGYRVTSNRPEYAGQYIFLPITGFCRDGATTDGTTDGCYWSSSLSTVSPENAWGLIFNSGNLTLSDADFWNDRHSRINGFAVRPVCYSERWLSSLSIKIDYESISMLPGKSVVLNAIAKSDEEVITNTITWVSDNEEVATVDKNGKVTAVSKGTARISASIDLVASAETVEAICTVNVVDEELDVEHQSVDLGLSVKWATFNVGAVATEDYGSYFAWGETETKNDYSWATYRWSTGLSTSLTKYNTDKSYGLVDNKVTLDMEHDAAHVIWRGQWRMPTQAEFDELLNSCSWTKATRNGINGYLVTSNKIGYTDRSIFLPNAGSILNNQFINKGTTGRYWSSSLYTSSPSDAWYVYFSYNPALGANGEIRIRGYSIRPVCP